MTIRTDDWIHLSVPELHGLQRPVVLRSQHLPKRHLFPRHSHTWNQFVYATSGTLFAAIENAWYVISPEQAYWVPTGIVHMTGALQDSEFRSLYIDDSVAAELPREGFVFSVTPLMRTLIIELSELEKAGERSDYSERVERLILDQLVRLPKESFHLPWPHSPMLLKMCQELFDNPSDDRDIEAWGRELGASPRTLHRRFEREVGIGIREWRNRLRVFRAIDLLGASDNITEIALELGYSTPSAFTYMFRQRMGCAPSEWRRTIRTTQ
ncbi:helix-turn-helix transcriptional regulator [Rhodoplanes sp. TEM]|uniref:Helix-turn-helix transcriptional regulator n=1 Tax=Rhodoplanes tepidamans TaxID=200616 RepID=A0ABT5JE38_RHOTP|nr:MULTISPECIES: helix-turn-helix transcriptional regulator [Rhodoplanes]MDC7787549.1 helix-turn-helix transcriptional regulator [Rhodoplanes tepidamans]MDC7984958.1 helix-turn-helix transcriptional regulator [Rhodoplanes sp. TEM]MDQ0357978.1 AraC-like DNA-binding protein [Rhodoplanes tepidamans]